MHGTKGLTFAPSHLKTMAQRACFALLVRGTELNITDIPLKLKHFDALVHPVMSDSCKVWAPLASSAALIDMEWVQVGFLRRLRGVPQSSTVQTIYAESAMHSFLVGLGAFVLVLPTQLPSRQTGQIFHGADRMQALGWGAAIAELAPLGQSLATIDEPFDCSLATSQLQASAQEAVMQRQPPDATTLYI